MRSKLTNKRVLVTGASGTVGQEVSKQLLDQGVAEVRGLDNNEEQTFLLSQTYAAEPRYRPTIGDVRDQDTLARLCEGMDVVIHAAGLKHVPLCELNPDAAVQTNILGVQRIIKAAREAKVKRVLFTSSDKAVNPTNVMGTSKLMGERLITAANCLNQGDDETVFFSVRFGNVVGSRGSVVPLFRRQIAAGGPVTLTHPEMTRFMLSVPRSVELVLSSLGIGCGGEVFITKMPAVRIQDLAEVMIEMLAPQHGYRSGDVHIEEIGIRPGEKLYEELMTEEELPRSLETDDLFIVLPAQKNIYGNIAAPKVARTTKPDRVYNSHIEENADRATVADLVQALVRGE